MLRKLASLMLFVSSVRGICEDEHVSCRRLRSYCEEAFFRNHCQATCNQTCRAEIDPCSVNNGGCSQICSLSGGSARCSCERGYRLADDSVTCVDINECEEGPNPCAVSLENYYCINTPGSYWCDFRDCSLNPNGTMNYYRSGKCCRPRESPCGVTKNIRQNIPRADEGRMRGVLGQSAALGQWPWQAQIVFAHGPQCGATLISDQWLVGAAHCFTEYSYNQMSVYLGHVRNVVKLTAESDRRVHRRIVRVIVHEDYNNHTADIALIELDKPVTFNDSVTPLCLPCGEKPKIGDKCWATGFGTTVHNTRVLPNLLQEIDVPVVSGEECVRVYTNTPGINKNNVICAGYKKGGKDTCRGDSGGPLACQRSDSCDWYLAGVTSFGRGCGRAGFYGVYANVTNYETWIRRKLGNEAPEPCDNSTLH